MADYEDQRSHPVTGALKWEEPLTQEQRKIKAFIVRIVGQTLRDAPTKTEAGRRLGATYRTVVRWRHLLGEL